MPDSAPSLDDLRREIDRIDDAIHQLILERTDVVERIARIKDRDRPALRPDREAIMLRRLLARHRGPFPAAAIVRIWRELISALTRLQGPFAVAVYAPTAERRGFWDIARDHYGSVVPMTPYATAAAVVRAVADRTATVGVVPFPVDDDGDDPWWRYLSTADGKTPHVVARLPFASRGNARGDDRDALAVASVGLAETGSDRTLVHIEVAGDLSRGRLKDALEAVGFTPGQFSTWLGPAATGVALHLVEIAGFVTAGDPRLAALATRLGPILERTDIVGAYAVPERLDAEPRG